MVEALDQPGLDRITARAEDDRNRWGRLLGGERGNVATDGGEHGDLPRRQLRGQGWQVLICTARPTKLDGDVLAFYEAEVIQALPERGHKVRGVLWRPAAHESDHRHSRLLRPRRERPHRRRATEQRDEVAPCRVDHGLPSGTR